MIQKVLLLLFVSLLCQSACVPDACDDPNPFFAEWSRAKNASYDGILLESSVCGVSSQCGEIWNQGTCCDLDNLKKKALLEKSNIDQEVIRYLDFVKDFTEKIKETLDEEKKTKFLLNKNKDTMWFIVHFIKESKEPEFVGDTMKCWNHMSKVRGAAMCYTCAADSQKYFKNRKALISEKSCIDMLDKCAAFFRDILSFLNGFVKLSEHMKSLISDQKLNRKLEKSLKFLSKIKEAVLSNDIIFNLNAYLEARLTKAPTGEVSKPACSSLYNLNKKPFIHNIFAVLTICKNRIRDIIEGMNTMIKYKDVKKKPNNSRLLQSTIPPYLKFNFADQSDPFDENAETIEEELIISNLIIGDVSFVKNENSDSKPMNLSLVFP